MLEMMSIVIHTYTYSYLKRCFGSWNCLENVVTKEAKWCIRTLIEECGPTTFRGAFAINCAGYLLSCEVID